MAAVARTVRQSDSSWVPTHPGPRVGDVPRPPYAGPQEPCSSPHSTQVSENPGPGNGTSHPRPHLGMTKCPSSSFGRTPGASLSPGGLSVAFHHCCPTGMSLPGCRPAHFITSDSTVIFNSSIWNARHQRPPPLQSRRLQTEWPAELPASPSSPEPGMSGVRAVTSPPSGDLPSRRCPSLPEVTSGRCPQECFRQGEVGAVTRKPALACSPRPHLPRPRLGRSCRCRHNPGYSGSVSKKSSRS